MQLRDAIAQDEFDALCKFADGLQSEVFYVSLFLRFNFGRVTRFSSHVQPNLFCQVICNFVVQMIG